jgi:hypothetical protein
MSGRPAACLAARALATVLFGGVASQARAIDWPEVPVPDQASGEIVSDHMIYNGISMRASRFTVPAELDQVERFYRQNWGKAMVVTPLPGKTVLGHMASGGYYITVELSGQGKATRGQIGVMQLPGEALAPDLVGRGFGRLPDTQVAEDIVYMDTPRHVRTLSMRNRYSPLQNQQYYTRHFAALGYTKDGSSPPCSVASVDCVSRFTRQDERITVTSSRGKTGTVVVAVVE